MLFEVTRTRTRYACGQKVKRKNGKGMQCELLKHSKLAASGNVAEIHIRFEPFAGFGISICMLHLHVCTLLAPGRAWAMRNIPKLV